MVLFLLYPFQKMKNFLKIFAIFSVITFSVSSTSAQSLMAPSLLDTMKRNEAIVQENFEEKKKTENLDKNITISPQFTPALAENYIYDEIYSGSAITIKKARNSEFYIQEINFASGARLSSALEVASYNSETGEPQFVKKNVSDALESFLRMPTSMINGQFFSTTRQPSELSFSLKSDGIIRTAGADDRGESKNILHITNSYAEILPYSWKNLENATGNFAIGSLTTKASKYKNENIGRTYVCTPNVNSRGQSDKILVFTAKSISEGLIENEIYKNGCTPKTTAKLDSSGSTRMYFNGKTMYGDNHK